jgi:phosphatidate cytidylyltransferase
MVRLVSGVLLAAAAVAAIRFLPIDALRVLAMVVSGLAAHEYLRIVGVGDIRRQAIAIAATFVLCGAIAWSAALEPGLLVIVGLFWVTMEVLFGGSSIQDASASLVAPIYTGAPLGMLVVIQEIFGWQATLLLIATVIVSDSSQYYTGRAFGRHALAPSISPKKTIEGAVGGVIVGTLFVVLAGPYVLADTTRTGLVLLGIALVTLGICGDLFESRLKRAAGMKDSSALIPGHGGILDRIDALLLVAPIYFLYLTERW